QYVEEYVKDLPAMEPIQDKPSWTAKEYMDKLVSIPNLMDLVSNSFLLTLALDALPSVVASKPDRSAIRLTRKSLATAIFIDHAGTPVVKYTHLRDKRTWKAAIFSPSGQIKLLRESNTVMRSGAFFRFLHRSLLEYFYSRSIYDPLDYDEQADEGLDEREPGPDLMACLARMSVATEPSIMQFLAERVPQDPSFRKRLLDAAEESKAGAATETIKTAATNATTILVKASVNFHGADLRGVKIPGDDLSSGQFDSAQFQGINLSSVNLGVDYGRGIRDMDGRYSVWGASVLGNG
ncbi:hypothetical protein BGZ47_008673, partial [Haplosporangium gracile]